MIQNVTPATLDLDTIRQIVREEIQLAMKKDPAARKACFIASKGTLDWAYPPLILATAAAAAGLESAIFFTFSQGKRLSRSASVAMGAISASANSRTWRRHASCCWLR